MITLRNIVAELWYLYTMKLRLGFSMPSSLHIESKRTPKLDQKYQRSQGRRKYSRSGGGDMHSEAPSNAKSALCKLKRGTFHTHLRKSGGTCPLCLPVPTSMKGVV